MLSNSNSQMSGALSLIENSSDTSGQLASSIKVSTLGLNANSSNNIYTDSGKVYPLSLALNFIIKT